MAEATSDVHLILMLDEEETGVLKQALNFYCSLAHVENVRIADKIMMEVWE